MRRLGAAIAFLSVFLGACGTPGFDGTYAGQVTLEPGASCGAREVVDVAWPMHVSPQGHQILTMGACGDLVFMVDGRGGWDPASDAQCPPTASGLSVKWILGKLSHAGGDDAQVSLGAFFSPPDHCTLDASGVLTRQP